MSVVSLFGCVAPRSFPSKSAQTCREYLLHIFPDPTVSKLQSSFPLQLTACYLSGEDFATSLPYRELGFFSKVEEMRYQNWDVLLFPDPSKIPVQEFKTSCQVIQDPGEFWQMTGFQLSENAADHGLESHNFQLNPQLLPTVTSFIPGLPAGAPFRVSIHCWQNPEFSRVLRDLKNASDHALFEARMFIDGRVVA